jgi:hypothetical protein
MCEFDATVGGTMRRLILFVICSLALTSFGAADAAKNSNGAWTLHYAGPHNLQTNTCGFLVVDCTGQLDVDAPSGPGRYDVYVIATDVVGIAETSFGLSCDGSFNFYGWTSCADSETPGAGWPGCGEGVTLNWVSEQPGPNVTLGILDLYVYGASSFCSGPDPRLGEAGFCDASTPEPICVRMNDAYRYGCVGFGESGYQSCPAPLPPDHVTWGLIKSLYVD